jgi:hypothetical protein
MATTAMNAVEKMFEREKLATNEERADRVKFLLSGEYHKRPFYYKTWRTEGAPIVRGQCGYCLRCSC